MSIPLPILTYIRYNYVVKNKKYLFNAFWLEKSHFYFPFHALNLLFILNRLKQFRIFKDNSSRLFQQYTSRNQSF